MVKSELINRLTNQYQILSLHDVELSINRILECISDAIGTGKRVEIRGFGSFSLRYRQPYLAHNPKTGERVYTKAKHIPYFKPGKALRDRVNEGRTRKH